MSESESQNESTDTSNDFNSLQANNFIRGNSGACLLIKERVPGGTVETAFITIERTYFKVTEYGATSKCKRFSMSQALERARESEKKSAELAAYQQTSLDIKSAIEFAKKTFELNATDSSAGSGLSRSELDSSEESHLEPESARMRVDEGW